DERADRGRPATARPHERVDLRFAAARGRIADDRFEARMRDRARAPDGREDASAAREQRLERRRAGGTRRAGGQEGFSRPSRAGNRPVPTVEWSRRPFGGHVMKISLLTLACVLAAASSAAVRADDARARRYDTPRGELTVTYGQPDLQHAGPPPPFAALDRN